MKAQKLQVLLRAKKIQESEKSEFLCHYKKFSSCFDQIKNQKIQEEVHMPRVLKAILKCQDYPGEITPTIFKSRENIIENFFYSKVHKIFIDNIRKQIFFEKYRNFPIVDPESEDYLFLFHSSRNIPLQLAEYNINRIVQAVQN